MMPFIIVDQLRTGIPGRGNLTTSNLHLAVSAPAAGTKNIDQVGETSITDDHMVVITASTQNHFGFLFDLDPGDTGIVLYRFV